MKYRKKPIVIEAVQWKGDNIAEVLQLSADGGRDVAEDFAGDSLTIKTLEGEMTASLNDWIIKGVKGEVYPCKPYIFEKTYELADAEKPLDGDSMAYAAHHVVEGILDLLDQIISGIKVIGVKVDPVDHLEVLREQIAEVDWEESVLESTESTPNQ